MSLIRRGVGEYNDADSVHMPGVIVSSPIMDMTYTWFDGRKKTSCDECTDPQLCPGCPSIAASERFLPSPNDLISSHDDSILPEYINGAPEFAAADDPIHDIDMEFVKSRERMGANTSKCSGAARSSIYSDGESLNGPSQFDSERAVSLGRRACKPADSSTLKILYQDTMGLQIRTPPSADNCEYTNEIGYVYKEPCGI